MIAHYELVNQCKCNVPDKFSIFFQDLTRVEYYFSLSERKCFVRPKCLTVGFFDLNHYTLDWLPNMPEDLTI
jgi:hypothetical protein